MNECYNYNHLFERRRNSGKSSSILTPAMNVVIILLNAREMKKGVAPYIGTINERYNHLFEHKRNVERSSSMSTQASSMAIHDAIYTNNK